jgi:CBS domain-containing protein
MQTIARKRIGSIMNKDLVTTRHDARLAPVVEMMMRRGLGEVAVVDHDHSLLGVVSRTDLVSGTIHWGGDSPEVFLAESQRDSGVTCQLEDGFLFAVESNVTVAEVMNRHVLAVRVDSTAAEAAALMAQNQLQQLPVISADGGLVGMISALDIARLLN